MLIFECLPPFGLFLFLCVRHWGGTPFTHRARASRIVINLAADLAQVEAHTSHAFSLFIDDHSRCGNAASAFIALSLELRTVIRVGLESGATVIVISITMQMMRG